MKVSPNLRGPSRKAKYSLATDSEPSSASERWEEPLSGEDSEPETTCLQAIRGRLGRAQSSAGAQIRNPNFEIRNKFEIRISKCGNVEQCYLRLQHWDFGFVSDFEIRISDFELAACDCALLRPDGVPFA